MPCRDSSFGMRVIQPSSTEEEKCVQLTLNSSKFNCLKILEGGGNEGTLNIYVRWSLTDDGVCYSLGFLECKIIC